MRRSPVFITLFVISAGVAACGKAKTTTNPDEPTACTEEAKVCPDGSTVARTGPNCEFPACPDEAGGEGDEPPEEPAEEPADATGGAEPEDG